MKKEAAEIVLGGGGGVVIMLCRPQVGGKWDEIDSSAF
jgi:hypothetical protein